MNTQGIDVVVFSSITEAETAHRALLAIHHGSETSGNRTEKRNAAVGGAKRSQHKGKWAKDVVLDDMSKDARDAYIRDADACGFWTLDEVNHIHIDARRLFQR